MPKASERALSLAREVLAKIAAYDPYFPKPNEAMLIAWGEHISLKNPDRDDMLDAVTKFYESNEDGSKPYPASISALARSIHQDRLMRGDYKPPVDKSDDPEPRRELEFRVDVGDPRITQAQWEERHGERFPELKVGQVFDADLSGNPLLVGCPWCHQSIGNPCVVPSTGIVLTKHRAHESRWEELGKVQREQAEAE